jgi:hypothetical protein
MRVIDKRVAVIGVDAARELREAEERERAERIERVTNACEEVARAIGRVNALRGGGYGLYL